MKKENLYDMRRWLFWSFIIGLFFLHFFNIENVRRTFPKFKEERVFLPPVFSKIFAGEFKGIMADFLVIDVSSYYGGIIMEKKEAIEREFDYIYKLLKVVTALDPYYFDTYYYAEAILAWDANSPEKANEILKIGMEHRKNDWLIPYWIGFNYYYFLKDRKKAGYFLKEASLRPGASDLIASMSAIVTYEGGDTEMAILFLEDMIRRTDEEYKRKKFQIRLDALKKILYLEKAITKYETKYGKKVKNLSELVEKKIIEAIPKDPYGGYFYIDENGKVKTTSGLRFVRKK